jgi:hypothetical protein
LQNQQQFADYNFDGANINVLLDILSYNSYLNAFYLNMAISESFLDSAQLRNSIISRAKELNYIPRSFKSSKATVNVSFTQTPNTNIFTIPSGTRFTGKNANGTYTYTTTESVVLYPAANSFTTNLDLYEGLYQTDTFVVNYSTENQRFIMTNQNIDTDSLIVTVVENLGQTTTTFQQAQSLYGLDSNSSIYFVQATEDTKYEIVFGDGLLGRKPLDGSIIATTYRTSVGTDANYCTGFVLSDQLGNYTISTITSSSGGANAESLESIRYNAPRHFQTQERAVTTEDYRSLVLSNYPDIKTCHVFGGETIANAVNFGTVFISPLSQSGGTISLAEKASIEEFLGARCTVGISPKVIDPDFLYLDVATTVKFDPNITVDSAADVQQVVSTAIETYNTNYLSNFNVEFKFSKFEQTINDCHPSISSNETSITAKKIVEPELYKNVYIDINYKNSIKPTTFSSSSFIINGRIYQFTDYNPNNNTFLIVQSPSGSTIKNTTNIVYLKDITVPGSESYTNYGTIDYDNGIITLNQILISNFNGNQGMEFYATPTNQDVKSYNNDILEIDIALGVTVNVVSI